MKALILVGGYGTRLRPLTLSVPKPLIHFCNKSIVEHQIEALVEAGVNHIILAVAYQPDAMLKALMHLERKFGITIDCSREEEPLGTAGPIRLAKELLLKGDDPTLSREEAAKESFFVFNSDVICEYPLRALKEIHEKTQAEGTIVVTRVDDPSKYGVVVSDPDTGKIEKFVEKPQEFVGDCINAGMYLLRRSVIDRIEPRPTSIEKETFPAIAADGGLYCMKLPGYWADIGQPKDFLHGMHLFLARVAAKQKKMEPTFPGLLEPQFSGGAAAGAGAGPENHKPLSTNALPPPPPPLSVSGILTAPPGTSDSPRSSEVSPHTPSSIYSPLSDDQSILQSGPNCEGNVLISPTAKIGRDCLLGPDVTIGPNCVIGDGVRLKYCAVMEGVKIECNAFLENCILGWHSRIGKWVRIEGLTVIGQDVQVHAECYINQAFVLPHKSISSSIKEPGKIVM